MVFSSPIFIFLFFPSVISLYFLTPKRLKNLFLFAASITFYAWGEIHYVILILISIAFNYVFGIFIDATERPWLKKTWLAGALAANLGILFFFKYAVFFIKNINVVLKTTALPQIPGISVTLPIGISFYTFQAISYIVDVYLKKVDVQRNMLDLGVYIAMFPQLIAGPIVRYIDIQDRLSKRKHDWKAVESGIMRFIVGLGKKVLIANTAAKIADDVFAIQADILTPSVAWIGIVAYTFQIYYDFSGYSDMAIGLGRIFGFDYPENFRLPYSAVSMKDFWRRWHISLSTWFRDYLYIPLGGNRRGGRRTYLNLLAVFILCGFWHGANWTFIVWGLWHGIFLVLERTGFSVFLEKLSPPFRWFYTMLAVMVGWVVFRSDTLGYALGYLYAMTGLQAGDTTALSILSYLTNINILVLGFAFLFSFPVVPKIQNRFVDVNSDFSSRLIGPLIIGRYLIYIFVFVLSASFLAAGTHNPFIYFRF